MNPKRNIIISSLVFISLFLLAVVLVIAPEIRGIAKDANNLALQRKEAEQSKAEENNAKDFQAFSSAHRLDMKRPSTLLVDKENPTDFLVFLDRIATLSNFKLAIAPGLPQKLKQDPWPSIPFQISSEGSSSSLRSFLQKLEYGPYLVEFKDVNVQVQKSASSKEAIHFSFSLKLYTK